MNKHYYFIVLALLFIGHSFSSAQTIDFEWKTLKPGAQYAQFQGDCFNSKQCISVFRYKMRRFNTDIVNDPGLLNVKKPGNPVAVNPDAPSTTTSEFGKRYGAIAAINGSYFDMSTLFPSTYVRDNGDLEGKNEAGDGAICIRKNNVAIVLPDTTDYDANFNGYSDVLASGPMLIKNGVLIDWPDDGFITDRHPRTAFGTGNGYCYMIVADGRSAGNGEGLSIPELAEVCRQLGCTDAINLDGGGSSALWVESVGVLSHPSDNHKWDHTGERVIPNAVIVR